MEKIIEISKLSFAYNGSPVLQNIDFSISPGEYISLIGPNGAGKSTLLKCLNRILSSATGNINLFKKNIALYSQREIAQMISYVSQTNEYSFAYTVYDFVLMGRYPYQKPFERESRKDIQIVNDLLELMDLKHLEHRTVNTLSGGERQKVYLAASLVQEPKILLLDEPTNHLDPKHQSDIQNIILKICRERNIAVLHVTHDLNHIVSFSHQIIALKNGQIIFNGAPEKIITADNLKKIFDTDFYIFSHPNTGKPIIVPKE